MTVEELIRELEKYDPKAEVITYDSDWNLVDIKTVSEEVKGEIVLFWDMIDN